ncbi:MAG: lysophospholipid acyltransferase family protein [Methylococcales bacterium]
MTAKLRLLYRLVLIFLLFSIGLLLAGGLFPMLQIMPVQHAKHYKDAIKMHWLRWFAAILHCRISLTGALPAPGAMVVCNHISWLDIIVLGRYLPGYFVAKSDILSWPVIGFLARQAGTIFIRRGDKKHIHTTTEQMLWLLKQFSHIMVFPEGTTTCGADVLPFHASLFQPALLTKSIVQPVAISYQGQAKQQAPFVGDDEFLPHLLKVLRLDVIEVRLDFLPVINSIGQTRASVSDAARSAIRAAITENSASAELHDAGKSAYASTGSARTNK